MQTAAPPFCEALLHVTLAMPGDIICGDPGHSSWIFPDTVKPSSLQDDGASAFVACQQKGIRENIAGIPSDTVANLDNIRCRRTTFSVI